MQLEAQTYDKIFLGIVGSPDFCRRASAATRNISSSLNHFACSLVEGWSKILTNKPNLLVVEIGIRHSDRMQARMRELLEQTRERFGAEIHIALALSSSEKLFYGGDLLFASSDSLESSGLVDTFLALPPSNLPQLPGLNEQLHNLLGLYQLELNRRAAGGLAVPALGSSNWVHSLADPSSRELWMRWLPRYASYTNENPIIIGRTGTGKTKLANALHHLSGRSGKFISITPRDFSSSELVQVELFGAVPGAYTGAVDKWGLVKAAEGGTLFIDELQSIDKELQGKLITFIENKVYRRVGSAETIEADVRFIFASNRTLKEMLDSDTLRDDFAYRLERVELNLLPLVERPIDIAAALAHSLAKVPRQRPLRTIIQGLSGDAYRMLFSYDWPGNLRQLENSVAQLCEIADMQGHNTINRSVVREVFASKLAGRQGQASDIFALAAVQLGAGDFIDHINSIDTSCATYAQLIRKNALRYCGGDIEQAAELIQEHPKLLKLALEGFELSNSKATHND